ncbi:MAG TPA: MerR family transcriptional regulator [Cytophagaceae bacterium]|jgi:DNA-binding transcriptional MerR regulator|nr:MerR family transcriptional regulator [Cytophagaceae bacterium]
MLIGELSKKTGVSRDTIRFYEKTGLIRSFKKGKSRRENNYREYSEDDLNRLQLILLLKEYGFTLNDIRNILHEMQEDRNLAYEEFPKRIELRLTDIEAKIEELTRYKVRLEVLLKEFSTKNMPM